MFENRKNKKMEGKCDSWKKRYDEKISKLKI